MSECFRTTNVSAPCAKCARYIGIVERGAPADPVHIVASQVEGSRLYCGTCCPVPGCRVTHEMTAEAQAAGEQLELT